MFKALEIPFSFTLLLSLVIFGHGTRLVALHFLGCCILWFLVALSVDVWGIYMVPRSFVLHFHGWGWHCCLRHGLALFIFCISLTPLSLFA
jgi:hypothetical protein